MSRAAAAARILFGLGALATFVLFVALVVAGLIEIAKSVLVYYTVLEVPESAGSKSAAAFAYALKGIEFLFLAPLGYLIFIGLEDHIRSHLDSSHAAHGPDKFGKLKESAIALMTAVVCTDLVGRALGKEELTYELVLTRCAVVLSLVSFLYLLRRGH